MDFIFMLTRGDLTVEDCLDVYDSIRDLGIRHLGFKDVGVGRETLRALARRMRADGATVSMEVVSLTREACLGAARAAADIGVHRLLGGTEAEAVLAVLEGSGIGYYPFPGRPYGHPTCLAGTPAEVARDCRRFAALGCAGVDLLAYRAVEAEPLELVRSARAATDGYLIVAGSINSAERVRAVRAAGADAFTVGSAVLDGAFSPRKGSLRSQLRDVLAACGSPASA